MRELIRAGAAAMGIALPADAPDKLVIYHEMLVETNRVMNLTRVPDDPAEAVDRNYLDSLAPLAAPQLTDGVKTLCDVGTGAGFPGLPVRIVEPSVRLTLLDAQNKRVEFLKEVCGDLGLTDVECVHGRAEEFAADHRESFDLVTSRAVANLRVLSELCLPLVKPGGYFLAMKSVDSDAELAEAQKAIQILGGDVEKAVDYAIPGTDVRHRLIFVKKIQKTDKKYPRTFAKIKKNPL